jgi:hypothetical protein
LRRLAALFLLLASSAAAAEFVQAVEFPYYLYPRSLWERELVWLKNIGIQTVEFSIPWNFHQVAPGETDLRGATSPRRDLVGFVKLLRRLGLRGWVRPLPPVAGLLNNGGRPDAAQQRAWLKELDQILATQTTSHGGPIAYVEGRTLGIDAAAPPGPVVTLAAASPNALARSREVIATARGALVWTGVEDAVYPAGWASDSSSVLSGGAVGLNGDERPATAPLRRNAALLRGWSGLLPHLRPVAAPKQGPPKLPDAVTVAEAVSAAATAVSITNRGTQPYRTDLKVLDGPTKRVLIVPGVTIGAGDSLWLPISVSLGPDGLCRECTNFSGSERVVYGTAELLSVEFENGILAFEFAAPQDGEVVLQLTRRPVGPFLAAGRPSDFEWDEHNLRARLPIPASKQPGNRVRIGIAIEAPDTSAFFNEARRLVIGRKNTVSTMYSSAEVAARSRLRLPEGYTASPVTKSPNEIDYEIAVPGDALHGDYAPLAIEADGVPLGRARLQLFRPASVRLMQGIQFHFGAATEMTPDPPVAAIEPRAGSNLEIAIRNNSTQIQTYHLEASGPGLQFFPPKLDMSVGPTDERRVELRVFADEGVEGLRDWILRVTGGADLTLPMRVIPVPRGRTVVWSADLDGDGSPEWILESPKVRAVFSSQDGGRWMEFTWKDTNTNFLPESGVLAQPGPVEVRAIHNGLEFVTKNWTRTVSLTGETLAFQQTAPLPGQILAGEKRGSTTLSVARPNGSRATFTLN